MKFLQYLIPSRILTCPKLKFKMAHRKYAYSNVCTLSPSFIDIRKNGQYFADNSLYIHELAQNGNAAVFCRPQRFGKSLFLTMMEAFHDVATTEEELHQLFGTLSIASTSSWTTEARKYYVLRFSFDMQSDLRTGNIDEYDKEFECLIKCTIGQAFDKYEFSEKEILNYYDPNNNASTALYCFAKLVHKKKGKLLILIDEYDRTMNRLMVKGVTLYQEVLSKTPSMMQFLTVLKKLETFSGVRYFVTGISPVFMEDVSGWNSFKNITNDKTFANMLGFTHQQVLDGLKFYGVNEGKELEKTEQLFKKYCNGYWFLGSDEPVYNSFLCANIFWYLATEKFDSLDDIINDRINSNSYLFQNAASLSRSVIKTATLFPDIAFISTLLKDKNCRFVISQMQYKLKFGDLIGPYLNRSDEDTKATFEKAIIFLYYHGILSFTQSYRHTHKCLELKIPNSVVYTEAELERLQGTSPLENEKMANFFLNPTPNELQNILNAYFGSFHQLMDNTYSEVALSLHMESMFHTAKAWNLSPNGSAVKVESPVRRSTSIGFVDFIIETCKDCIIIELKRIRPNILQLYNDSNAAKDREKFVQMRENMYTKYSHEDARQELCALPLDTVFIKNSSFARMYEGCSTVQSVIDNAISQLNSYTESIDIRPLKDKYKERFHKYVVVQVGFLFVVVNVPEKANTTSNATK